MLEKMSLLIIARFDQLQNVLNCLQAWKKLLNLDAVNGILKRKLTIIDLRLKGKVIVKLKKSHSGLNKLPESKT